MASRRVSAAIGASLLAVACGSTTSSPPPPAPDAGTPFCPAGPNSPKASTSTLPTGVCHAGDGPCNYEATPCPNVPTGTVNGYECTCVAGTWSCEIVNQSGLCAPLPGDDGGGEDAGVVGPSDAATGGGPTGPTGPNQP